MYGRDREVIHDSRQAYPKVRRVKSLKVSDTTFFKSPSHTYPRSNDMAKQAYEKKSAYLYIASILGGGVLKARRTLKI